MYYTGEKEMAEVQARILKLSIEDPEWYDNLMTEWMKGDDILSDYTIEEVQEVMMMRFLGQWDEANKLVAQIIERNNAAQAVQEYRDRIIAILAEKDFNAARTIAKYEYGMKI